MRDRAEELGGRLDVRASEGGGTVVEAVLPLLIGAP
jgi:signal transduction histidine kinase